jgi:hypothetical protein
MGDLPAPNPALARKIWDSMTRPSTRRVATRLRQAGIPVSHQTINRWSETNGDRWSGLNIPSKLPVHNSMMPCRS